MKSAEEAPANMVFESYGRRAPASFPREAPDTAPEYNSAQAERT